VTVAQSIGPSIIAETSVVVRSAIAVFVVLVFGGIVLRRREAFVRHAIDELVARPAVAVLYGLVAYVVILVVGAYVISQVGRLPGAGATVAGAAAVVLGTAVVLLTGVGFVVVGTVLVEVRGRRDLEAGLLVGATLSGLAWAVLPPVGAAVVWILVGAFGIGGAARDWFRPGVDVDRARSTADRSDDTGDGE
jgi:hypothetical protein